MMESLRDRLERKILVWQRHPPQSWDATTLMAKEIAEAADALLAAPTGLTEQESGRVAIAKVALQPGYRHAWQTEWTNELVADLVAIIDRLTLAARPVLTAEQRAAVEWYKSWVQEDDRGWSREDAAVVLAILDELVPPPAPAHKPCPACGSKPEIRNSGNTVHIGCSAECGMRTESKEVVLAAWAAWDRRVEKEPKP